MEAICYCVREVTFSETDSTEIVTVLPKAEEGIRVFVASLNHENVETKKIFRQLLYSSARVQESQN